MATSWREWVDGGRILLGSPRLTRALTEVILVVALATHAVRAFVGWPGTIAIIASLIVLCALSLISQPEPVRWRGMIPFSLLAFFGLTVVSVLWSQYNWATLGGVVYTIGFAALGCYVALVRDTIQVVRSMGNALRVILGGSLIVEVLSGVIIDTPLTFLGVSGNLALGGPIEGLVGTRNALAFLAALAVLTFWIEYRTRSVEPGLTWASLALAGACLVFARSPVSWLVLGAVGVTSLTLFAVRRLPPGRRRPIQASLLVAAAVLGAGAWLLRRQLVDIVDAAADVVARTSVWADINGLATLYPTQGWGWVGRWPVELFPFASVNDTLGRPAESALNAFVDVRLQLGVIGVVVLLTALVLAFARAWLLASERRSSVHVWPALTLVLLIATSVTESYLLFEGGLLLFVLCAMIAARGRSWRTRLADAS